MTARWEYVYFIKHPHGYWKVGESRNPRKRKTAVQIGSPYELELSFAVRYLKVIDGRIVTDLEPRFHERLEEHHTRGEWYEIAEDGLREIANEVVSADGVGGHIVDHPDDYANEVWV